MKETIGSFVLIKNEGLWIKAHLARWLPVLDEMVFFDGDSTDGTLEILQDFERNHPQGHKIKLHLHRDPKDLQDDYVSLFNEALRSVESNLAFFNHPDFMPENPDALTKFLETSHGKVAAFTRMRSFAGEPGGQLFEIKTGRVDRWKAIYRRHNPDLGVHYFGHYGAANEDCYFSKITGDEHKHYGGDFQHYPYEVVDSGLNILHFSDVRTFVRRLGRMKTCLINQGHSPEDAETLAHEHPRVTLRNGNGFTFEKMDYPDYMVEAVNV